MNGTPLRISDIPSTVVGGSRIRTLQELNEHNHQFWSEQSIIMEQRMADPDIINIAMSEIQSEYSRLVPVYYQRSFEEALELAAGAKARFQKHTAKSFQTVFSKKGGAASKLDSLQKLILEIAGQNPHITQRKLFGELQKRTPGSIVIDIDMKLGSIEFNNKSDQQQKIARISGLKDRLSRAKKKLAKEEKKDSR
jgi:hypothetical protein